MINVFIHIPKTGGSTIRTIFSNQYNKEQSLYFEPGTADWPLDMGASLEMLPTVFQNNPSINFIAGHHVYGIHQSLKKPCRYISMVREPLERMISDYYFAYSFKKHRLRKEITSKQFSCYDFVANPHNATPQTFHLLGQFNLLKSRGYNAEVLKTHFYIIGTNERFDESILLIAKSLGWEIPFYLKDNITTLDPSTSFEREKDTAIIKNSNLNELYIQDYKTYDYVNTTLTSIINSEGSAFQNALNAFREIQKAISRKQDKMTDTEYFFKNPAPLIAKRFSDSEPYRLIQDYLHEPLNQHLTKNYLGHVEGLTATGCKGWAGNLLSNNPVSLTIYHRNIPIGESICNFQRNDLSAVGLPHPNVGFEFVFNDKIHDIENIEICFEKSNIKLHD